MRSQGLAHRRDAREDDAVAAQLSAAVSHLSLTRMAADGFGSNPPQAGGRAAELRAPSLRGDLDLDRAPLSGASAAEAFRSGPNSDPWLADEPSYAQRPALRSYRGGHTSHQGQLMPPPPDAQPRSWVGEHGERGERWAQGGDALAFEQQSHGLSEGGFVGRHAAPWSIAAAPMRDARVRARPTTSFRLFVGKLSPTISKAALRSHFVNVLYMCGHFNPDGAIVDVYLPQGLPSHPRGFAFVSFADQASLEQVVSCEGGHIIEGHPCVFDIAAPRGVRVNTNNSLVRHRARAAASANPASCARARTPAQTQACARLPGVHTARCRRPPTPPQGDVQSLHAHSTFHSASHASILLLQGQLDDGELSTSLRAPVYPHAPPPSSFYGESMYVAGAAADVSARVYDRSWDRSHMAPPQHAYSTSYSASNERSYLAAPSAAQRPPSREQYVAHGGDSSQASFSSGYAPLQCAQQLASRVFAPPHLSTLVHGIGGSNNGRGDDGVGSLPTPIAAVLRSALPTPPSSDRYAVWESGGALPPLTHM